MENVKIDVDKNKIISILDGWIEYIETEREKIIKMKNIPSKKNKEEA